MVRLDVLVAAVTKSTAQEGRNTIREGDEVGLSRGEIYISRTKNREAPGRRGGENRLWHVYFAPAMVLFAIVRVAPSNKAGTTLQVPSGAKHWASVNGRPWEVFDS